MAIYLYDHGPAADHVDVWEIEDSFARRYGLAETDRRPGKYFALDRDPAEDIWEALRRAGQWFATSEGRFHKSGFSPGECYPRIARPTTQHRKSHNLRAPLSGKQRDEIAIAESQLKVLLRQLERICQTVHPSIENQNVYGHDIRNLLILACTEVESHWRAVLVANGIKKERYTTADYVRIAPVMKLADYGVHFANYPWIAPLRPFRSWGSSGKPTLEIAWYDAYNKVKHDRESQFALATLDHVFHAVAANAVMIAAQFGFFTGLRIEFAPYIDFSPLPEWSPAELYIQPQPDPDRWVEINCPL